jgi:beta-galactosidase
VIAPALHVLSQPEADNLRAYVENGGMLLVTARTGVKDENNAVVNLPLPGPLAEVCGVEVEEYDPLPLEANIALQFNWPGAQPAKASLWCDILNPGSAQTVARYQDEYYAGRAAITLNHFGKGQAVYAGTLGDEQLADTLVAWLIELCQIKPVLATPTGVEAIERWQGQQQLLFILNHSDREQVINLPVGCKDLLSGRNLQEAEQIAPRDVWIVVKPT